MSETIKVRWLVDNEQTKVAPKTLSSQVINEDGTLFKDEVNSSITALSDRVDYINDVIDNKVDKTDIVQADWNQNDPTASDYVKNRTHWIEDDGETYHPLDEKFIPETVATKGYVEALYTKLNSNTVLGFYCIEDVTIVINGIPKTYSANSNVEISFIEGDEFEIVPTSDNSILTLNAFPGTLGTFYPWLEGVRQFSNILFDMNSEDMYTKWNQGNQGAYQVQFAQYVNCIFWSDNPYISDVAKRTNYTLCSTSQLPLCYSNIPDNTFKSFYLAFGVNSDPNWSNPAYKESFAKATWATQAFSYYGARIVGFPGHDSSTFTITLPKDCRGLMFDARNIECAGTFDATNTTNFGAKSGSWREAFGDCISLRRLYIKNLKVNLNISWSPIDYDSISYIISAAANTSKITISVSPYTYNLLSESDFELATSKNITIALLTENYVEDKRLAAVAGKADENHTHDDEYDAKGSASNALDSAKAYTDNITAQVKNDLLNGAGEAYDTLKELGDLIDENVNAIEALELVASGKQDKNLIVTYIDSSKIYVSHDTDTICDAADTGIEVKFFDGREYLGLLEYDKTQHMAVFYVDYYDSSNVLNVKYVVVGGNSIMMADTNTYHVAYKDDLNKKQDAITGTEGQIVQINSSGKAVASDLNLITIDDIDTICGGNIEYASMNEGRFNERFSNY